MTGTLLLQKRNTFRNLIMMVAYHLDLTTTKKKKKKSIWTSFIGCHLSFFVRKGFIVVSTQYIILLLLQAFLCYVPRMAWKALEGKSLRTIIHLAKSEEDLNVTSGR